MLLVFNIDVVHANRTTMDEILLIQKNKREKEQGGNKEERKERKWIRRGG